MDKRSRIYNLRLKYTLLFLVATVCLVQHALAGSIRDAFEKLRSKKVKDHRMSSDIKGAICTSSTSLPGRHPISKSLRGMVSSVNSLIIPRCPRFKSAIVNFKVYLD